MYIRHLEEQIKPKLKWNKIEDIPDFPISNFKELKKMVANGEFQIGIDFSTANTLAEWLYGKGYAIFFLILASTPFIVAILSIILVIVFKNLWLIIGLPLGFLGMFMSNPYNPSKKFWESMIGLLFLIFLWAMWQEKLVTAFLSASFVVPFLINRFVYSMNQNKLRKVVMNSEKIFIFLYQTSKLGLKNNKTGEIYWYKETILKE